MYKVFVVDDEVIVRESIRSHIEWESAGFSLCGEASDGEMALSLMKDLKPDILLTDIRMPFLDGLELAGIVRQSMPWVRVILLSGHDEFDYAQRAISIGVQEYLLKPVGTDELLVALRKAAAAIEEERRERSNAEALKALLESSAALKSERLFSDLLSDAVKVGNAIERAYEIGLEIVAARYMVMVTALANEREGGDLLLVQAIIRKLAMDNRYVWQSYSGVDRFISLIKADSDGHCEELAYAYAQAVKHEIERNTGYTVSVGLGGIVTHLSGIPKSYREAGQVLERMGHVGAGKILEISDLDMPERAPLPLLERLPVREGLKHASVSDIPDIIDKYTQPLGGGGLQSMLLSNYLLLDLCFSCARLINEYGGDVKAVLPELDSLDKLVAKAATREGMHAVMRDVLGATFRFRDGAPGPGCGSIIRKAQLYIDENYASQDISLNTVAAHVALSSNHFCTVFAQETGQTFIEYLTAVRMRRAKELLADPSLRTSEVCYAVGYNDPHYFSYIFKKHTGMAPRAFRAGSGQGTGNRE